MIGVAEGGISMQASRSAAADGRVRLRARWTVGGLPIFDLAVAALLSCLVLAASFGLVNWHAGPVATAGILAITVPVAWRSRAPVTVAGIMAAAALLNGLLFGPLVRCGVALPAFFLAAFAVSAQRARSRAALGVFLCVGGVVAGGMYYPHNELPG